MAHCPCGSVQFDSEGGYGMAYCLQCGIAKRIDLQTYQSFSSFERIPGHQSYTRRKRFKKYLCRAMRQQSSCTVPRETWDYLLSKRPYRDAKHIQWTLKQARHLKRKCYDSLPFLTAALCPGVLSGVLATDRDGASSSSGPKSASSGCSPPPGSDSGCNVFRAHLGLVRPASSR